MGVVPQELRFDAIDTRTLAELIDGGPPMVVLLPVGSVEPHGPHLPLGTDTVISQAAAVRAAPLLTAAGMRVFIAPPIPFGVTECARGFKGAVSIPAEVLTSYVRAAVESILSAGIAHVCLINNHLEPEHDAAIHDAAEGFGAGLVSVACPLERRWARTLSEEFKRGECHAGEYETAIVLAADPDTVKRDVAAGLPEVPVSLSDHLRSGVSDFGAMGLGQAYAGAPAAATPEHGEDMLAKLAEMVATEVREAMDGV